MAPGTKIEYWWILKDANGEKNQTKTAEFLFEDNRFNWQSLTAGQLTIYWYEGNPSFAGELMKSGQIAINTLTEGTEASLSKPIRLYIYSNTRDMRGGMVYSTGWEGGMTYADYPVVIGAVSPGELAWGKTLIAHELSHMVTRQLTMNPYGGIPTWLNEGIAVHAEGQLSNYRSSLLRNAITDGDLISVMSLTSQFSADSKQASLSYVESFSIVDFLVKTYGQKKISELLAVFKQGSTYDEALKKVYGFDTEGLHAKWLSWVNRN